MQILRCCWRHVLRPNLSLLSWSIRLFVPGLAIFIVAKFSMKQGFIRSKRPTLCKRLKFWDYGMWRWSKCKLDLRLVQFGGTKSGSFCYGKKNISSWWEGETTQQWVAEPCISVPKRQTLESKRVPIPSTKLRRSGTEHLDEMVSAVKAPTEKNLLGVRFFVFFFGSWIGFWMDVGFLGCNFPWSSHDFGVVFESWNLYDDESKIYRSKHSYSSMYHCIILDRLRGRKQEAKDRWRACCSTLWHWKMMPQGTCDQSISCFTSTY